MQENINKALSTVIEKDLLHDYQFFSSSNNDVRLGIFIVVIIIFVSSGVKLYYSLAFDPPILGSLAGVAQWVNARLKIERPQLQVQSLLESLLRSLKQAPIDDNCLRSPSGK